MSKSSNQTQRSTTRRAVALPCIASTTDRHQLCAEEVRDISDKGMLLAARWPLRQGQELTVTFKVPGPKGKWLQATTEVSRIVRGDRALDAGYAVALRFTELADLDRSTLQKALQGIPPTIPQRALRVATQRTVAVAA